MRNSLEPKFIIDTFIKHPPYNFKSLKLSQKIPAFITDFDLLTTFEEGFLKKILKKISFIIPKPKTLFVGTTVSEYALFPKELKMEEAVASILEQASTFPLTIVKDLPSLSPLLDPTCHEWFEELISCLKNNEFEIVSGEFLAYVPIDFSSVDEFLGRMSKNRRKDLKRKLKKLPLLNIEELDCGHDYFNKENNCQELYGLYKNVYESSYVHFDLLSSDFFRDLFQDKQSQGKVFLYRALDGKIIGFNLCYLFEGKLVDKYIGFLYPDSLDYNLYFISWFHNLEYCLKHSLSFFVAGWTDKEIKTYLGAKHTQTYNAVYFRNPLMRKILKRIKKFFEQA